MLNVILFQFHSNSTLLLDLYISKLLVFNKYWIQISWTETVDSRGQMLHASSRRSKRTPACSAFGSMMFYQIAFSIYYPVN